MTAPLLEVRGVSKAFGSFLALDEVSFQAEAGEFVCLLGPSGCGKTTLLRCIAGLETQTAGTIVQAGRDISWLPPSQRDFGIVFQSYALFPNLSVFDNVAFGLVNDGMLRSGIAQRVRELLDLVGLQGQDAKFPSQLSGGQQQRVALARALAPSPGLLLLDEPLSALDAKVRAHLRREIRDLQKRLGVTTLMVTHDQEEAQTMADRVVVMNRGRIEQIGTPEAVYDRPASAFVANFIGVMNFLKGTVAAPGFVELAGSPLAVATDALAVGSSVRCAIRPEHVRLSLASRDGALEPGAASTVAGSPCWLAQVDAVELLGPLRRVHCTLEATGETLCADAPRTDGELAAVAHGQAVSVFLDPSRMSLYAAAS